MRTTGRRHAPALVDLSVDAAVALATIYVALALRLGSVNPAVVLAPYLPVVLVPPIVRFLTLAILQAGGERDGLGSRKDLVRDALALGVGTGVIVALILAGSWLGVPSAAAFPRSVFFIEPVVFVAFVMLARRARGPLHERLGLRSSPGRPGQEWRLGYRPALDGIRGIAIILVVLAHASLLRNAGAVGVNLFFVLSGFLITTLLLAETGRNGRIDLVAFYRRRAARLLPALFLVCAFIAVYLWNTGDRDRILPDVGGALSYVGNWLQIAGVKMVLTSHTWSLAVEEQFYLVWPLMMILIVRSSRAVWVVAGLLVVAVLWRAFLEVGLGATSPRTTRGTDVIAVALLGGGLLAFWLNDRPSISAGRAAAWFGTFCLAWSVAIVATGKNSPVLLEVTTIGAVLLIASQHRAQRGPLTWAPLRYAGRISYGWYLWHFPIFAILHLAAPVEILISVVVSMASFHFFELPLLRRFGHRRPTGGPSPTVATAPAAGLGAAAPSDRGSS